VLGAPLTVEWVTTTEVVKAPVIGWFLVVSSCTNGEKVVRGGRKEGVWRLTSPEEDRGFSPLSGCDLDGDGLRGGRKEVSVAAERSECGAAALPAEERSTAWWGGDVVRSDSEATAVGHTRSGGAQTARWRCGFRQRRRRGRHWTGAVRRPLRHKRTAPWQPGGVWHST
jgi:hypothetical protein